MIKSIILVFYNLARFQIRRLFTSNIMDIHYIQRVSPFCSIKLFDHGMLKIGRNCDVSLGCDFQIHGEGVLEIGAGVYFNRYCMISVHQHITIGENCIFGPGVKIFDNNHLFDKEHGILDGLNTDDIEIGNNCWISSDVIILKGVHIGNNTVIGAGCIIYHDIPAQSVVVNNQNLQIKPML